MNTLPEQVNKLLLILVFKKKITIIYLLKVGSEDHEIISKMKNQDGEFNSSTSFAYFKAISPPYSPIMNHNMPQLDGALSPAYTPNNSPVYPPLNSPPNPLQNSAVYHAQSSPVYISKTNLSAAQLHDILSTEMHTSLPNNPSPGATLHIRPVILSVDLQ